MSADAALLPCPVCTHNGVFHSVDSLRDRLLTVSTNKIVCPVCQEEVFGLEKLAIHLSSHLKVINNSENILKSKITIKQAKSKPETSTKTQEKKAKSSQASKNKVTHSTVSPPVKFVKIYPKLPVIPLNAVPIIDISKSQRQPVQECIQNGKTIYVPTVNVKTESSVISCNTTCNICGLQFVDSNILRMHKCLIHNIDENSNQSITRYDCYLCSKTFKMRGSLMVHLRVAHYGFSAASTANNSLDSVSDNKNDTKTITLDTTLIGDRNDNKQWQCDVCRKCFTTKYFLKKHKRLHTGETPYACTQCNKTFTFQQSYHKHLLYHNDEKPHTCTYCGRAFKELSTLHNHQRIHTGEKPFSCESCGKCFRQRVSYLVHRRIHTGVMPYKCTACEKSFRYKVSQRTHKCQVQPPGTVVRQTGDLVEKLKKKHAESDSTELEKQMKSGLKSKEEIVTKSHSVQISEISEDNVELARKGAELSLEDIESENFSFLVDAFDNLNELPGISHQPEIFSELHNSVPIEDKNVPSPSEILKNLCLSKDEDITDILQETDVQKEYDFSKELNLLM